MSRIERRRIARLVAVPSLAFFVTLIGCGSEPGPIVPVRLEGLPRQYSGLASSARETIRDPARWASIWFDLVSREYPMRPVPRIDFGREMVLLAALGERPSGGFSISIEHVAVSDTGPGLTVQTRSTAPGQNCIRTLTMTQPVDAVLVPRLDYSVQFIEENVVVDCPP